MRKAIKVMMIAIVLSFGVDVFSQAQEVPPECLNFEHSLMLRCIQRGIQSVTEYKSEMESEAVNREAPPEAVKESNPVSVNEQTIAEGKVVFNNNCAACHGASGRGDGPTAEYLGNRIADLTSQRFQGQSDGTIFWKITEGSWPMPAFGFQEDLSREDIWKLINYIRTLAQ